MISLFSKKILPLAIVAGTVAIYSCGEPTSNDSSFESLRNVESFTKHPEYQDTWVVFCDDGSIGKYLTKEMESGRLICQGFERMYTLTETLLIGDSESCVLPKGTSLTLNFAEKDYRNPKMARVIIDRGNSELPDTCDLDEGYIQLRDVYYDGYNSELNPDSPSYPGWPSYPGSPSYPGNPSYPDYVWPDDIPSIPSYPGFFYPL